LDWSLWRWKKSGHRPPVMIWVEKKKTFQSMGILDCWRGRVEGSKETSFGDRELKCGAPWNFTGELRELSEGHMAMLETTGLTTMKWQRRYSIELSFEMGNL
jgi:hypothetical protein